jgi:hypothetical protein
VALVTCVCWLLLTATASAADFTWSGTGTSTAWSEAANWLGGSAPAPSSTIGTLTFPALPAVDNTNNDLSGLTINHLQIDDTGQFGITGEGVTLGSGGLSVTGSESVGGPYTGILVPITLSETQSWSVSGPSSGLQLVELREALSGSSADLTVNLNDPAIFTLGDPRSATPVDDELGNLTITGMAPNLGDVVFLDAKLNTTDGKHLTAQNLDVQVNAPLGGLIAEHTRVEAGATMTSVSFDAASSLAGELKATGPVDLGGATLEIATSLVFPHEGECPTEFVIGTPVSTTGNLTGTFGNAPNDSTLSVNCFGAHEAELGWIYPYRVTYTTTGSPQTVTLTPLPRVKNTGETTELPPPAKPASSPTTSLSSSPSSGQGVSPAVSISAAQLASSLAQQLRPAGKAAGLTALLKHGGLTMPFTALEAGTLTVDWYMLPSGAKLARKTKARPILVAAGKLTFSAAGTGKIKVTLTAQGKKLLKHVRRVKLEAWASFTPRGGTAVSSTGELRVRR